MINFIKKEKRITVILILAIIVSLIYVFTNRLPELFPFGYELMLLIFSLAVSIIAAVIFYVFQIYLPSIKIRKIAKKELHQICSQFIGAFTDALISCSTKKEIEDMEIAKLDDFLVNRLRVRSARNLT